MASGSRPAVPLRKRGLDFQEWRIEIDVPDTPASQPQAGPPPAGAEAGPELDLPLLVRSTVASVALPAGVRMTVRDTGWLAGPRLVDEVRALAGRRPGLRMQVTPLKPVAGALPGVLMVPAPGPLPEASWLGWEAPPWLAWIVDCISFEALPRWVASALVVAPDQTVFALDCTALAGQDVDAELVRGLLANVRARPLPADTKTEFLDLASRQVPIPKEWRLEALTTVLWHRQFRLRKLAPFGKPQSEVFAAQGGLPAWILLAFQTGSPVSGPLGPFPEPARVRTNKWYEDRGMVWPGMSWSQHVLRCAGQDPAALAEAEALAGTLR